MRMIIEYGALVVAGWLAFDVLFVIAWARLHWERPRYEDRTNATVTVLRPNDDGARSELACLDQLADESFQYPLKKTS
jgi:hypothetical protein